MITSAHDRELAAILEDLDTDLETGLSTEEARRRLAQNGPNELKEKAGQSMFRRFLEQFRSFLVILLLLASGIAAVLGEMVDAAMIMAIVTLNAVLGLIQESKAEKALAALRKMAAPSARVIRDGVHQDVPSRELVPGDVALLEAGYYVPADMRLAESANLRVDEAALTGESVPVEKRDGVVLPTDIPLGDRVNSAFMSTVVAYGRGKGVVVGTGMKSQIGAIAEMIQSYEEGDTPLQQRLAAFGKLLGTGCLVVCAMVFAIGLMRGEQPLYMFMVAVSLAIAAVPEGLPAIVTICLALGMQRMIRRHALIRKLPAVETLGSCSAICSDKTGTLTQNEMTVVSLYADGGTVDVEGRGYQPAGRFLRSGEQLQPREDPALELLLRGATLCNDAVLEHTTADGDGESPRAGGGGASSGDKLPWRMVGDPTEGALVVSGAKAGLWKEELELAYPRVAELPFDSDRKRMTTIHQDGSHGYVAFVKGAPDILAGLCASIYKRDRVVPLGAEDLTAIQAANDAMSGQALRVLAVACRSFDTMPDRLDPESVETGLTFVGLMGMIDPPRPEAKAAVQLCKRAGIKSVMITGDHKNTAVAVAEELGILADRSRLMTGEELDRISDQDFGRRVEAVDVYARVSPAHKVKIVDALKARGHVVAMTGDGVNDAPALKRADIGVAMGIAGTDVTKGAAAMVLTDDNFASIVSAVEEGRVIYSNIRKFVFYLLSCNVGEIMILFMAMIVGLPVPLQPVQLLWLNLLSDGLPALALGLEKGEPDIMDRPPRPAREPILNSDMRVGLLVQSIVVPAVVLGAMTFWLWQNPGDVTMAQTMAFLTLAGLELPLAFAFRSDRQSVFTLGVFSNRYLVMATASSFLLLLGPLYLPGLQGLFEVQSPGLTLWLVALPLMLVPSIAAEITKAALRRTGVRERQAATLSTT